MESAFIFHLLDRRYPETQGAKSQAGHNLAESRHTPGRRPSEDTKMCNMHTVAYLSQEGVYSEKTCLTDGASSLGYK